MKIRKKREIAKNPYQWDLYKDGLTQGSIGDFLACRRKFQYRMYDGLEVINRGSLEALEFGTVLHAVLERVLSNKGDSQKIQTYISDVEESVKSSFPEMSADQLQEFENVLLGLERMLPVYFRHYDWREYNWVALEKEFCIQFPVEDNLMIPIRGKIDGIYRTPQSLTKKQDELWLFETKSKSHFDPALTDWLVIERQVALYSWAMKQIYGIYPKGVTYNLIRRPQLRRGKGESITEFAIRLRKDVELRPEFYFQKLNISLAEEEIENNIADIRHAVIDIAKCNDGLSSFYKNSGECLKPWGACKFLNICSRKDKTGYFFREKAYPELEE